MQPPPRKVRVAQELKQVHVEQINRLQIKHQSECELLEDLRAFSLKRAAIERDYAQALHKLAAQHLKRDWTESVSLEPPDHRNMFCLWRAYLEGTVQLTQSRLSSSENYKLQVSDPAKSSRLCKEQQLRKCVEQLTQIQAELQESVKDLTKSRKKYQEAETMAQAVREKAELEAKSKLSLFQSRSSLQRATVKLKAKRNECNSKATNARNDYLLMLAAANAHQRRYYDTDLTDCIKVLDGRVHEQVKDFLVSLCQTELDVFEATHGSFTQIFNSSSAILQQFHLEQFVEKNPMFQQATDFLFQPNDSDTVTELQRESGTAEEHTLDKEARKWSSRVAREYKSIIHTQRALEEFGADGPDQNPELDSKMEVARQSLRRAQTVKAKAEARLDLLRGAGVVVETWLKSAMNQVMEELENERWSNLSVSHDPALEGTADLEREDEEEEDSGEVLDDSSSSPSSTLKNYPLTCKVLYSYKASQPDELTIEEQDVLEVIDDGDMEDWVKARNRSGQVGYVPEKYLQLPSSNSLLRMLQALASLDQRSHSSSNSTEPEMELSLSGLNGDSSVSLAKALYDYSGQTEEELSFPEGAILRVLRRELREDDGFWEGEFNGRVGVFPAVLVEDLTLGGEDSEGGQASSPSAAAPPRSDQSPPPRVSVLSAPPLHSSPLTSPTSPSSPLSSPCASSPVGRPPSYNSHNGLQRAPKSPFHSPVSPQPPKYPESPSGSIRPVRAAPPPPKQHPRGQVKRREEVEITLV